MQHDYETYYTEHQKKLLTSLEQRSLSTASKVITYSLNAVEWKSTLFGVLLGSLHLELNPLPNYSGIHSKVVVWITLLRVDSTILSVDFHSKMKWSLIWLLKEWVSTPAHLQSMDTDEL